MPSVTSFNCTVKAMLSKTYGKMPDPDAEKQIIMEYEYYTDTFVNNTIFNTSYVSPELYT